MPITVVDSVYTPTALMPDEVDLVPIAGMERMCDPDGPRHLLGAGCS